jgi:hypothetical protein
MNAKRILALAAALLMIIALFSACANDTKNQGDTGDKGKTDDSTQDEGKTDDGNGDDGDQPEELEIEKIDYMAFDLAPAKDNYNAALERGDANLLQCVENQHKYGIEVEASFVSSETYSSVISSSAASGVMPEVYFAGGNVLDAATYQDWIKRGMFLSLNEVMEHSSGNMIKAFGEDGIYAFARAMETIDGDWYGLPMTNATCPSIQITESDGPLRITTQVHGAYDLMIRQDWLDDLGLGMPQTVEEYYEACLKMNTEDVNGNGLNDERIITALGGAWQYMGIGQWYGLALNDFLEDPSSGEVEVNILKEGFTPWVEYMNRLYSDQLIYNNEGMHPWVQFATYIAEDNVISWFLMIDTLWSSARSACPDADCNYQPLPIYQAVEGVAPRVVVQEAMASNWPMNFNAETCSPEKAAKMADCIYSYEQWLLKYYGVEGYAWEYAEDGSTIVDYTAAEGYVKGDIENQYLALQDMSDNWSDFMTYFPSPFMKSLWATDAPVYSSHAEALEAGEPYAENGLTEESWMAQYSWDEESPLHKFLGYVAEIGDENINWAAYYSFPALATEDELLIQNDYGNELKTYLQETTTKLIIGDYDIAELQSYIDFAYENLYLQEYIDAQQGRVDRFLEAIGR